MKLGLLTHFFNEELLLPEWIKWHKDLFDVVWLLDHQSTDRSDSIIKELAPEWKIIPSKMTEFDASWLDREVSETEHQMKLEEKPDWIVTLNITEIIFTPNFRERLEAHHKLAPDIQAFGMRSFCLVDPEPNDSTNLLDHTNGYVDFENGVNGARRWRFIHNWLWGNYQLGRHGTALSHTTCPELLIAYWQLAPYPKCKQRKQQIASRMPIGGHDRNVGNGFQHIRVETDAGFNSLYEEERARSFNLLDFPLYREYYEYWRQRKDNEIQTGSTDT